MENMKIHEAPEGTRLGKTTHTRVVLSGKLQFRYRVEGVMCELDSFNSAFQVVVSSGGQAREVRTRSDVIRALLLRKISFLKKFLKGRAVLTSVVHLCD